MKVKVTDPCYVIDTKEWDRLCKEAGDAYPADWSETFDRLVNEYLKQKTGKTWATAGSTYYGDWSNTMYGTPVISGGFYADAGMWCVVPAEFNERGDMATTDGAAILDFDDDQEISVRVAEDNNKEWAEIEVSGLLDNKFASAYSASYKDDEIE